MGHFEGERPQASKEAVIVRTLALQDQNHIIVPSWPIWWQNEDGTNHHVLQCGENCTGMRAMPVGKLSKTGKIKESYQNIHGQMSKNVENTKALINLATIS